MIHRLFLNSYLTIRIRSQASGDYDPSLVTEVLKEIEHSDTPSQDVNLLKDVASQAYLGKFRPFTSLFFWVYKAVPQREQTPLFRQSELSFWQWYAIPRCRRRLKQNLTKSLTEDFPNIPISFPFPISRHSLKKFIGMLQPVVCFMKSIHRIPTSSRWEPLAPLGRTLSLFNN